jgi:putative two-component system response regulator
MCPDRSLNLRSAISHVKAERPARILIVDDDAGVRALLAEMVTGLGCQAIPVSDVAAALEMIAAEAPDLVLSDVTMPGASGFDLCRRLKADPRTRLIPVVLVTGIGDEFKLQGIDDGADDFLSKPFNLRDLRVRIRALLRMKFFTDELEHAEAVLCLLGKSVEAKDPYTEGHCERLARYAVALGRQLRVPDEDLRALRLGGYLHDLGKLAVPDAILLKPASLSGEEQGLMRQHPALGEAICRPLRSLQAVLPIIRHHHEKQDGSGYPDGLGGEEVPLTARILQVVDVYDALTTDRPYRRALTPEAALQILVAETRRAWWDPGIVRAFQGLMAGEGRSGREPD